MKRLAFVTSLILVFGFHAVAQNLESLVNELSGKLQTVNTGKKEIGQSLRLLDRGVLMLEITETDSKGKTRTTSYVFNPADIDKHTLLPQTRSSVIVLEPMAEAKQKVFKKTYESESPKFVYQFKIYASDINNARDLAGTIKTLIAEAKKKVDSRLTLTGYNDRTEWLRQHNIQVQANDKNFDQAWEVRSFPGSVSFRQQINGKKNNVNNVYDLNLSTLHPMSIRFVVKDNVFGLKVETANGNKYIRYQKDGNFNGYVKNFFIATNDVEDARDIKQVLTGLIKDSKKKIENILPENNGIAEAIEKFNDKNNQIQLKDKTLEQELSGDCLLQFKLIENKKGKTYEHLYKVELSDIYPKNIRYTSNGSSLYILLPVKGEERFIQHIENGKLQNYRSKLFLYTGQIDDAIFLTEMFKNAVKQCAQKNKGKYDFSNKSLPELKQLLARQIKNLENDTKSVEQIIEFDEENIIRLKKNVMSSKSGTEYIYEIGLNDLNPKSVRIKISGKKATVSVSTNQNAKIIKFYKNGKIQPYKKDLSIEAIDIQNAKNIAGILKSLIEKSGN